MQQRPQWHALAQQKHASGPVLLAKGQRAFVTIYVAKRVLEPYAPPRRHAPPPTPAEIDRLRLQQSVRDLSLYLERLSGAAVAVVDGSVQDGPNLPILVGELASQRFGPPKLSAPGGQALRLVISREAIGLVGESDLAVSYAIYELLERLGCRWFMPGPLGEEIPRVDELALPESDESLAPSTWFRNIWYADDDFRRRNRLGGLQLAAGHQLERWVSAAEREQHPEWRAIVGGQPHRTRLRWDNPELAAAIADAVDANLTKTGSSTASVSPADGGDFDESTRPTAEAADWDPHTNAASLTDSLLQIANRVAARVSIRHPDARLGLLIYDRYARPPRHQRVHPNLVPVFAPINYCRTHPISDDACPGALDLRDAVTKWSAQSREISYRSYAYNLAEPSAPFPMQARWSYELPFFFAHKARYFQPETLPNFETALPALYLGIRLAWKADSDPTQVLRELYDGFYGHAAGATSDYLAYVDRLWTQTPEYSGGSLGYAQRFPPEAMQRARALLELAKRACKTPNEARRVGMLDASLTQFELFMKLYRDLRQGRLATLDKDAEAWSKRGIALSEEYAASFAFGKTGWAKGRSVGGHFFERFLAPGYREAARIFRDEQLLAPQPLCVWKYRTFPDLKLPVERAPLLEAPGTVDACQQTWSTLGLHDYFGTMVYETSIALNDSDSRSAFLWLSSVDGMAQAWVNGVGLPLKGQPSLRHDETHLKGLTFDASGTLHPGNNSVVVAVRRTTLAELGGGGVVGPVYIYRSKAK